MTDELKYIIESLLFVSETPLTMDQLKNILEGEETAAIRAAVEDLIAEYEQRNGGFVLKQVAGGYQFRTQGRYNEWIKRLVRPNAPRLSKAALETLAIIAYNQPIIRSDIEHIRGVDSGGVIRMLMERKLIRVLGRKEIPGRPLIYATTKHFLEVFELKDLKDLPTPKEIEELSKSRLDEEPNGAPSENISKAPPPLHAGDETMESENNNAASILHANDED
ncbi:SMC-Scp complex subunit ScpB [uncultured Desulfosarcina sp.]|uniref:SMC-Scp complex subunit ScpB n=1 Tax=uncultured Desulfosarcina sp. TaxID=218289 RepID=UPI0029C60DC4|nr:SMC-Scp complex subunit ScpB [uncultured Desulfosarcina sp.]